MDLPSDVAAAALREEPPGTGLAVANARRELVPLADRLRLTLADIILFPVEAAAPQERADLVALREEVDRIKRDASMWVDAIDLAIRRGAIALGGAKQIPTAGGYIEVTPQRDDVKVDAAGLREELIDLARTTGAVTDEDIEAVFTTVVEVKADGSKLNYLARNRGAEVADAIERHRTRTPANPLGAKLRFVERAP